VQPPFLLRPGRDPGGAAFEAAFQGLSSVEGTANAFWDDFSRRLNEALENEFEEEVEIRRKVKKKFTHKFKPVVSAYADLYIAHLSAGDLLPPVLVSEPGPGPRAPRYTFRREGAVWEVNDGTDPARVKHTKGMLYLQVLLQYPNKPISASDLVAIVDWRVAHQARPSTQGTATEDELRNEGLAISSLGGVGENSDEEALANYERALADREVELEVAERGGRTEEVARLNKEMELFRNEIKKGKRRRRHSQDDSEDAQRRRKAVSKCIAVALKHIEQDHNSLWKHLDSSLGTGHYCCYRPRNEKGKLAVPDWDF
jgi:hypothetical protein